MVVVFVDNDSPVKDARANNLDMISSVTMVTSSTERSRERERKGEWTCREAIVAIDDEYGRRQASSVATAICKCCDRGSES